MRRQIQNLEAKDFDMEAWKTSTRLLLERIFGPGNPRIREIENIHYDLSSWSLRDNLGTASAMDASRRTGKAVLEACIMELEILGEPGAEKAEKKIPVESIRKYVEDHLTVSQLRELREIMQSKAGRLEKQEKISAFLDNKGDKVALDILSGLLCDPDISSAF